MAGAPVVATPSGCLSASTSPAAASPLDLEKLQGGRTATAAPALVVVATGRSGLCGVGVPRGRLCSGPPGRSEGIERALARWRAESLPSVDEGRRVGVITGFSRIIFCLRSASRFWTLAIAFCDAASSTFFICSGRAPSTFLWKLGLAAEPRLE